MPFPTPPVPFPNSYCLGGCLSYNPGNLGYKLGEKKTVAELANLDAEAIPPETPREEAGYYWGYTVRRAETLSAVYTEPPFEGGYDYTIGTSERGVSLLSILPGSKSHKKSSTKLPSTFNHLLLVFGGVAGLEPAVASDQQFQSKGLTKETAHEAFDAWVNLVQGQGSRTIRTEEAIEIGLAGLKGYVDYQYEHEG